MKNIWTVLGAIGIGAFLMYLFDPRSGNRRRALIRDKAVGISNDIQETLDKRSRDLSNRAKGLMHEAKSAIAGDTVETAETENSANRQNARSQTA